MNTKDSAVCVGRSRGHAWWERLIVRSSSPRELRLEKGQLLSLDNVRGLGLRCLHGETWITQSDDEQDHLLEAGDSLALDRTGRVVIEALSLCRLSIR